MQVRQRMVNHIKETIKQLSEFKPDNSSKQQEMQRKLASTIEELIQDTLIELKYSAKLLPEVSLIVIRLMTLVVCVRQWCILIRRWVIC